MARKQQSIFDILGYGDMPDPAMDVAVNDLNSHYHPSDYGSNWDPGWETYSMTNNGMDGGNGGGLNPVYKEWARRQIGNHYDDPVNYTFNNQNLYNTWASGQDLKDVLTSPIASTSYYQKTGTDLDAAKSGLLNQLQYLQNAGVNYGNKAMGADQHMQALAADLARYGVDDLSKLKTYKVKSPTTGKDVDIFYNPATKAIIPTEFGSNMGGEGGTYYSLRNVNGQVVPVGSWEDTSDKGDILSALSILAIPATMGLTTALAPAVGAATGLGATGATALTGAGVQGLTSGLMSQAAGGDFGKGFLTGAVGSGIGSGVQALNPAGMMGVQNATLANSINKGISGGLSGLTGAAINGGNVGQGALSGLTSGAISGAISPGVKEFLGGDKTASMIANLAGSQAGKYGSNALLRNPTGTTSGALSQVSQVANPSTQTTGGMRQLDLSRLPQQAQDRIKQAYGALTQYGANLGVKI